MLAVPRMAEQLPGAIWSKNLTVVLTISLSSSSSPLSTNMRIPNTAEVLTIFAAIGRFSNLPGPGADSELSLAPADADYADYADSEFSLNPGADGADLEYSLSPLPQCVRAHTVKHRENCNSIGKMTGTPTYQIICENAQINGQCTNLGIGQHVCLGRQKQDCKQTGVVTGSGNAQSLANQFNVPLGVFMDNNYCYNGGLGKGRICPQFHVGSVVCTARTRVKDPVKCPKIF